MPIIDPEGLYFGDRMANLSTMARLHWPHIFLLCNASGRFEINLPKIISKAYATFRPAPTAKEISGYIREYFDAYLLFVYRANGSWWGQWDTSEKYLPRYKDAEAKASPAPPQKELESWREKYQQRKSSACNDFRNISEDSESFHLGEGGGVGIGDGVGGGLKTSSAKAEGLFVLEPPTPKVAPAEPLQEKQDRWFEEEFWPAYWRKVDKADAIKVFRKHARNEAQKDRIVAAVHTHAPMYLEREIQHRPHAATWLNRRRYEEPPEDTGMFASRPRAPTAKDEKRRAAMDLFEARQGDEVRT